jgi:ornithine cyclodeaminase/alanine dehydrogenase-like protein (mu-crystallin family)
MKVLCILPGNPARGLDAHMGVVVLLDGQTGSLRAVADASAITAIRTAAVSAVAIRALARPEAETLAIIGTGVQATRHLQAVPLVRPIRVARIAGRTPERARTFIDQLQPSCAFPLCAAASPEEAVRGADIVVTATSSRTPVVERAWIAPGAHLCAVGASRPPAHELDAGTMAACALYTDRRDSLAAEAAEWQAGLGQGHFGEDHLRGELGEVLIGARPGRQGPDEITLFRSLGLASEDLAALEYAIR